LDAAELDPPLTPFYPAALIFTLQVATATNDAALVWMSCCWESKYPTGRTVLVDETNARVSRSYEYDIQEEHDSFLVDFACKLQEFLGANSDDLKEEGMKNVWLAFMTVSLAIKCPDGKRFVSNSCNKLAMRRMAKLFVKQDDGSEIELSKMTCIKGVPDGYIFDCSNSTPVVLALLEFKNISVYGDGPKKELAQLFLQLEAINSRVRAGPLIPGGLIV
jgi:hypothetical protein